MIGIRRRHRGSGPERGRGRANPAFLLPLIIMLTLVVGIFTATAMYRFSAQQLTVRRQLDAYIDHHVALGIQEAINGWAGLSNEDFTQYLEDGDPSQPRMPRLGVVIDLEDGSRVEVYFADGQGLLLRDARGLSEQEYLVMQEVHTFLTEDLEVRGATQADYRAYTRPVGPASISVRAAPLEVLDAVTHALLPTRIADGLLARLIELRDRDEALRESDLQIAFSEAGLDAEQTATMQRVLTVRPRLYYAIVEVRPQVGTALLARFGGYVQVGRNRSESAVSQKGRFETWERLPVDPEVTLRF